MPNIKSAKKRVRVSLSKRQQNFPIRTMIKTYLKKFEAAMTEGDQAKVVQAFKAFEKSIDKAAGKGLLHKNTAARKKSRLAKRVRSLGA